MFELKKISRESIPDALEKAERYRLINEPRLAESICLDILEIDPQNNKAIVIMLLAITDQFDDEPHTDINQARQLLPRLSSDYERYYYGGIICERQGKAVLIKDVPDGKFIVYEWLRDAMALYEEAERTRPPGNDDAILRWNTCARLIMRHQLVPREERREERYMEQQLE